MIKRAITGILPCIVFATTLVGLPKIAAAQTYAEVLAQMQSILDVDNREYSQLQTERQLDVDEMGGYQRQLSQVQGAIATKHTELDAANKAALEADDRYQAAVQTVNKLKATEGSLGTEIGQLEAGIDADQSRITYDEDYIDDLSDYLEDLWTYYYADPTSYGLDFLDEIASVGDQIDDLQSEIDALQSNIPNMEFSLQQKQSDLTNVSSQIPYAEADVDALKPQVDSAQAAVTSIQEELTVFESEQTNLELQINEVSLDIHGSIDPRLADISEHIKSAEQWFKDYPDEDTWNQKHPQ